MFINCKKIIVLSTVIFAGSALALPSNSCGCKTNKVVMEECKSNQVQSPSWWKWLTSNKSSQLHFFQLIELLHTNDVDLKDSSAKVNKNKSTQDS